MHKPKVNRVSRGGRIMDSMDLENQIVNLDYKIKDMDCSFENETNELKKEIKIIKKTLQYHQDLMHYIGDSIIELNKHLTKK